MAAVRQIATVVAATMNATPIEVALVAEATVSQCAHGTVGIGIVTETGTGIEIVIVTVTAIAIETESAHARGTETETVIGIGIVAIGISRMAKMNIHANEVMTATCTRTRAAGEGTSTKHAKLCWSEASLITRRKKRMWLIYQAGRQKATEIIKGNW